MITRILLIALALTATALADLGATSDAALAARPSVVLAQDAGVCAEALATLESSEAAPEDAWLTDGAPAAIDLVPLASGAIESLPPPALLSVARVQLAAGAQIAPGMAAAPRLYVVETGSVTLFRSGVRTQLGAGSAGLVQPDTLYAFVNDSSLPVQFLRLSVERPNTVDRPVFDAVEVTETPGPTTTPPVVTSLFRGELGRLPAVPARFFAACAAWQPATGPAILHQHPGPVGLKVLSGILHVTDGVIPRTLRADGCTLLDPRAVHQSEAGDEPPVVLVFGIIEDGEPLWREVDVSSPGAAAGAAAPELRCG